MTYGYMTEESGYNVWMKGRFGLNQELKGSTMELITMDEGNALIGHLEENGFVIHMTVMMATIWCEEANAVWEGIPMFCMKENKTGDPDIQDYIDFCNLILETMTPDFMPFKDEYKAWEARKEAEEMAYFEEESADDWEQPIEVDPETERRELTEMYGEEIAERMMDKDREIEFDFSWLDEPLYLVERLRDIRKYLKEHPEDADVPPEA